MQFQIYLGLSGPDFDAHAFDEAHLPGSSVKTLAPWDFDRGCRSSQSVLLWKSQLVRALLNHPEEELCTFLFAHKEVLPLIRKYRNPGTEVFVTLIAEYQEGEEPRGFSFDAETISLLHEFGAALEIDAVHEILLPEAESAEQPGVR